ncbi:MULTISPECIES: MarR family winged helix-turn-helix transcriptional regulator [Kocuria]|uniref:MarR family transcriptional regulator n=1 Tax=Kocuria subflava TaxID=1736139 RepID=A0A846TSJ7_9MICC|nr:MULTISPECIES: MarR family transcriptional regulator [Kocuria]NKE08742.1 MarR family transcriptional regulator [Kocuria subflava]
MNPSHEHHVTPPAGGEQLPSGLHRELMLSLQDFTTESSRYADSVRRAYGLGHSDVHALSEVMAGQRHGSLLRAGDIARRLVISASAATAVIDRLVKRGHLVRQQDARDRREVVLKATPTAAATGKAMFSALEQELGAELATWSEAEISVLRRRMPQLTEAVRRAQDVTPPPPDTA